MTKHYLPCNLELKSVSESENESGSFGYFEGYGAVFGTVDTYKDIIEKGAFGQVRPERVSMFWQHNMADVLGSYSEIREDNHGLYVKGRLNLNVSKARDAYALLKAGDLTGLSIGFSTIEATQDRKTGMRHLKKVKLHELSLVSNPAIDEARIINVKSVLDEAQTLREIEEILMDVGGFSSQQSKTLISKISELKSINKPSDDSESSRDAGTQEGSIEQSLSALLETLKATI